MTYGSQKMSEVSGTGKVRRRALVLLAFMILFLVGASFFVMAAAADNQSDKDVEFWNENRDDIKADYQSGTAVGDIAGTIQFDEKNVLPFYSSLDRVDDGASVFGRTMPGQAGRSIILGHQEQGFAYLANVEIGDEIVVDSLEGTFVYTVKSTKVVVPSEIPFDETDESTLTLVSRYPFRSFSLTDRRYVVELVINEV